MTGRPANFKDMTGQRFTRLVVLSRAPSDKNGNAKWHCRCDCGASTVSSGFTLRNGEAKSCGCLTTDQLVERVTTHKMSGTPEWWAWVHMFQRCGNPNNLRYHRYGARGIKVCERWNAFESFFADMGPRPSPKHTLERRDRNGNYEPGNCAWDTKAVQNNNKCNNRYVAYKGQRMTLMQALEAAGTALSYPALRGRLKRGWPLEEALETPPNPMIWTHAASPSEPTSLEERRRKRDPS